MMWTIWTRNSWGNSSYTYTSGTSPRALRWRLEKRSNTPIRLPTVLLVAISGRNEPIVTPNVELTGARRHAAYARSAKVHRMPRTAAYAACSSASS